jgi:hypothetical protein
VNSQFLNDLLGGTVLHWAEEMRRIRGKTRPSWRILKEVNRILLSLPERLTYDVTTLFWTQDFGGVGGSWKVRMSMVKKASTNEYPNN